MRTIMALIVALGLTGTVWAGTHPGEFSPDEIVQTEE